MTTTQKFNIYLPSGNNYKHTLIDEEHTLKEHIVGDMLYRLCKAVSQEEICENYQVKLFKMGGEDEVEDFDFSDEEITLFALIKNIQRFDDIDELEYEKENITIDDLPTTDYNIDWILFNNLVKKEGELEYMYNVEGCNGSSSSGNYAEIIRMDRSKCIEYICISISACIGENDDDDGYIYHIQTYNFYCDGTAEIIVNEDNGNEYDNEGTDISF